MMPENLNSDFAFWLGALCASTLGLFVLVVVLLVVLRKLTASALRFVSFRGHRADGEVMLEGHFTETTARPGLLARLTSGADDLQAGIRRDEERRTFSSPLAAPSVTGGNDA